MKPLSNNNYSIRYILRIIFHSKIALWKLTLVVHLYSDQTKQFFVTPQNDCCLLVVTPNIYSHNCR